MKHPEYSFIELAVQGAGNRGKVGDVRHMGDMTGKVDCYKTVYRYPKEFIQHWEGQGHSVKGYNGPAYADWLPMDIDCENIDDALMKTRQLIQRMEILGVDVNACRFYVSSGKGYHILIPSGMMGAEPSVTIHKRFKQVALYLGAGIIDSTIYDKTRLFRLPNTINSKSGLYKVELYPDEILNFTTEEIKIIAQNPRYDVDIETDYDVNEDLQAIYSSLEEKKPRQDGPRGELTRYKTCIAKLVRDKDNDQRNNSAVRIVGHFKDGGLTHLMAWVALNEWNDSLTGPLEQNELQTVFESVWTNGYSPSCTDDIKRKYCSETCILYKDEYKNERGRGK